MEINGRPRRVKFQLGDQILLCPVGEWNLFITPKFPLQTEFLERHQIPFSVLLKFKKETWNLFIYSVRLAHSYFYL